jgi:hypothetical protein
MALQVLVEQRLIDPRRLPCGKGRKRIVLGTEPVHPSGKPFIRGVSHGDFVMETHFSVDGAIRTLGKVLDELGVAYRTEPLE